MYALLHKCSSKICTDISWWINCVGINQWFSVGSVKGAGNYPYKFFFLYQYKLVYNCRVIISPNLITINHEMISKRIIQCDQRGFMQFFRGFWQYSDAFWYFLHVYSIWCFQFSWESISMPKNLVTYTLSIDTLFILMSISETLLFLLVNTI